MEPELQLAHFVHSLTYAAIPKEALDVVRRMLLTVLGTAVAGAGEEGAQPMRDFVACEHARGAATVWIFGDQASPSGAALVNGVMSRALDYCDAMAPGLHIGSSLIPAAIAAMEAKGGCSGEEFLTALTVGAEVASRLNLSEQAYDGADPTGVAAVFGATAAAARLLGLTPDQTLHALALAFNRAGGSFQSNVDGSLAVRLIQGWVAESGVMCAQLAQRGMTGPRRFLSGVYGYAHLFGKDLYKPEDFVAGLGERYALLNTMFKKYPSCGLTQGITELALQARDALSLTPDAIRSIQVVLPPYAYKLVGHDFVIGDNPRVNAQFSAQYCVANAIVRGQPQLTHFTEALIRDADVCTLAARVKVVADEAMSQRHHTAAELHVETLDGSRFDQALDIAPGFPGNGLPDAAHLARFRDCMSYAAYPLTSDQIARLIDMVASVHALEDARALLVDMVSAAACTAVPNKERTHNEARNPQTGRP